MADYAYVDGTGLISPDTSTLQTTVEDEFKAALGADLIVTADTPQGVLIAAEVAARSSVLQNNSVVANQINPNYAGGVFLDAIWALTGGERLAATPSTLAGVELLGLAGTVIPAGSQASIADGTVFETTSAVTLDINGEAVVDFQAVEMGAVSVAVGALNQIVSAVLGWDSVNNPTAASVGRSVESDISSRLRRKLTLSLQNVALPESIISGLYNTEGVKSLAFRENTTSATAVIDGITLLPHSIWVCVYGGTDAAVAATILEHKSLGCDYNGAVSVNVTDAFSGQIYPVKFDRPTLVPIRARVTVKNLGAVQPIEIVVQEAILAYAQGLQDGENGLTVGTSVSAFELAGAVNRANASIYVTNCEVSLDTPINWSSQVAISLNQLATIIQGNIQVIAV